MDAIRAYIKSEVGNSGKRISGILDDARKQKKELIELIRTFIKISENIKDKPTEEIIDEVIDIYININTLLSEISEKLEIVNKSGIDIYVRAVLPIKDEITKLLNTFNTKKFDKFQNLTDLELKANRINSKPVIKNALQKTNDATNEFKQLLKTEKISYSEFVDILQKIIDSSSFANEAAESLKDADNNDIDLKDVVETAANTREMAMNAQSISVVSDETLKTMDKSSTSSALANQALEFANKALSFANKEKMKKSNDNSKFIWKTALKINVEKDQAKDSAYFQTINISDLQETTKEILKRIENKSILGHVLELKKAKKLGDILKENIDKILSNKEDFITEIQIFNKIAANTEAKKTEAETQLRKAKAEAKAEAEALKAKAAEEAEAISALNVKVNNVHDKFNEYLNKFLYADKQIKSILNAVTVDEIKEILSNVFMAIFAAENEIFAAENEINALEKNDNLIEANNSITNLKAKIKKFEFLISTTLPPPTPAPAPAPSIEDVLKDKTFIDQNFKNAVNILNDAYSIKDNEKLAIDLLLKADSVEKRKVTEDPLEYKSAWSSMSAAWEYIKKTFISIKDTYIDFDEYSKKQSKLKADKDAEEKGKKDAKSVADAADILTRPPISSNPNIVTTNTSQPFIASNSKCSEDQLNNACHIIVTKQFEEKFKGKVIVKCVQALESFVKEITIIAQNKTENYKEICEMIIAEIKDTDTKDKSEHDREVFSYVLMKKTKKCVNKVLKQTRKVAKQYFQYHFDVLMKKIKSKVKYINKWMKRGDAHITYKRYEALFKRYEELVGPFSIPLQSQEQTGGANNSLFDLSMEFYKTLLTNMQANWVKIPMTMLDQSDREELYEQKKETQDYIQKLVNNLSSFYNNDIGVMDIIMDSQFITMYILKLITYIFFVAAFYLAEKLFSEMYMKAVYADGGDPPNLSILMFMTFGLHFAFVLFLLTILMLFYFLFKNNQNNFVISKELIVSYLIDYGLCMLTILLISFIITLTVQNKRYFKYKTEGLRAVRATRDIMSKVVFIIFAVPFFAI